MTELLNAILVAAVLLFFHWAIERWPEYQLLIYPLILLIYFLIFKLIDSKLVRGWKQFRRWAYPQAAAEGYWIGKPRTLPDDGGKYTVCKIYYSKTEDCWIHRGYRYDAQLQPIGDWKIKSIKYQKNDEKWFFYGHYGALNHHPNISKPKISDSKTPEFSILEVPRRRGFNTKVSWFYNSYEMAGLENIPAGKTEWQRADKETLRGVNRVEDINRDVMKDLVWMAYHAPVQ